MNGRYENGALPEKVRLLYEAVLAMVTDGWDINRIKVSDITAQAGIGKGTAYEYFSSKEEIIANAVLYDVEMRLAHVLEITKGEGDFAGKFVQILTYMEEVFAKRQAFCLLVRIGTGSYEVSESMRRECEKRQQALGCHLADRIVESLMCQGVSEGTIGGDESILAEAGVRGADDSVCRIPGRSGKRREDGGKQGRGEALCL